MGGGKTEERDTDTSGLGMDASTRVFLYRLSSNDNCSFSFRCQPGLIGMWLLHAAQPVPCFDLTFRASTALFLEKIEAAGDALSRQSRPALFARFGALLIFVY